MRSGGTHRRGVARLGAVAMRRTGLVLPGQARDYGDIRKSRMACRAGAGKECPMPSPFPGMDPFLEYDAYFYSFRQALTFAIEEVVKPHLPDSYFAELGDRRWFEIAKPH